jgi:mannitol/fructose-specific phosphotransferase system IIA component (Ntr-type)
MKLSDFIVSEATVAELSAANRNDAIKELVEALRAAGRFSEDEAATIAAEIIRRENQGSTGFGYGVAVPHVKHAAVSDVMAAVGRSSAGIDFSALDRAPVYTIILLISPPDKPDAHLQAMENIFRHLQRDNFRRFLRQASTREEIMELVREADESPA